MTMITKVQLKKDLEKHGITPSDTLLIHSSMKAVGPVEGGADAVLDCRKIAAELGLALPECKK